jgi:short-subunit dehydrogenase
LGKLELKGKRVLITGASSGIGRELAACFAGEGCDLLLGCLPSEADILDAWTGELRVKYGVEIATFPLDLAEDNGPERLYDAVKEHADSVDVLVNNAGVLYYGDFHDTPLERHELLVKVNLVAYFKLMWLFISDMVVAGEGRVLNVVSTAAFQPTVYHASYGAAKAFVQSMSEAVNEELKGTGVKVCTFNPSYTDTPLLRGGGFPARLWWFWISGLSDPAVMARKAVKAFKKEKAVYIPGFRNWFVHTILVRVVPRRLSNLLAYWVLREAR